MKRRQAKFGLYELSQRHRKESRALAKKLGCLSAPAKVVVVEMVRQVYGTALVHRDSVVVFRGFNDFGQKYSMSEPTFLSMYRFVTKRVMQTVTRTEEVYAFALPIATK